MAGLDEVRPDTRRDLDGLVVRDRLREGGDAVHVPGP